MQKCLQSHSILPHSITLLLKKFSHCDSVAYIARKGPQKVASLVRGSQTLLRIFIKMLRCAGHRGPVVLVINLRSGGLRFDPRRDQFFPQD